MVDYIKLKSSAKQRLIEKVVNGSATPQDIKIYESLKKLGVIGA